MSTNPFFETWNTPFGMPPFDRIRVEHIQPAYDKALPEHVRERAVFHGAIEVPSRLIVVKLRESGLRLAPHQRRSATA